MIENPFVARIRKFAIEDITKHLTWHLEIKDPDLYHDFKAYGFYARSSIFVWLFALFVTIVMIPSESLILSKSEIYHINSSYQTYSIIYLLNVIILAITSWYYVIEKYFNDLNKFDRYNSSIFLISLTTLIVLRLIRSVLFPCEFLGSAEYALGRNCHHGDAHSLTWDTA